MTATIQRPVNDFMDGDILSLSLPFNGEFSREPQGPRRPQDISITEDELFVQNPTDHQWRSQFLGGMPQLQIIRQYGKTCRRYRFEVITTSGLRIRAGWMGNEYVCYSASSGTVTRSAPAATTFTASLTGKK